MTANRCLTPFCALVLVLGCSSAGASKGEADGRAAAEKEIARGRPHLVFIGLAASDHSPLDPSTGLLQYSRGCVIDDESAAYVDAHNGAILAALREGRLAGMTFEKQALSAGEARAPFAEGAGLPLAVGDPAVEAPGGGFTVEFAPRFGGAGDTPYFFVIDGGSGKRTELVYVGEPKARIAFAHGGKTLLVRDDAYGTVRTFDLVRGLELQVFPDDDRGW